MMKMKKVKAGVTALAAALLAVLWGVPAVHAQDGAYPQRAVKIIVPFPPGQATDIIGRVVAQKFSEKWGQPVVVDNRPGAGGITGVDAAVKSAPDGYTLLVAGSGPLSVSPAINANLPYAPLRDLRPLGLVASMPMVLVSAPEFPAKSLGDLLAMLKAKPGDIAYASSGTGSTGQLAAELMLSLTQTTMIHVPYKGSGPALSDVMAGRVPVTVESQAATLSMINSGKLRAIAVTSAKRSSKFPAVPTFNESGLPNFDVSAWIGVLGQAALPPAILKKIAADLAQIMEGKDVQQRINDLGLEAAPLGAEQFAAHIRQEIDKYTAIAKGANIKVE
jgi:tripartite-type tricarboxylate transporter receptor subunit TctC